jgi:hypothetical protein
MGGHEDGLQMMPGLRFELEVIRYLERVTVPVVPHVSFRDTWPRRGKKGGVLAA